VTSETLYETMTTELHRARRALLDALGYGPDVPQAEARISVRNHAWLEVDTGAGEPDRHPLAEFTEDQRAAYEDAFNRLEAHTLTSASPFAPRVTLLAHPRP
jgi:hypothetical protein